MPVFQVQNPLGQEHWCWLSWTMTSPSMHNTTVEPSKVLYYYQEKVSQHAHKDVYCTPVSIFMWPIFSRTCAPFLEGSIQFRPVTVWLLPPPPKALEGCRWRGEAHGSTEVPAAAEGVLCQASWCIRGMHISVTIRPVLMSLHCHKEQSLNVFHLTKPRN